MKTITRRAAVLFVLIAAFFIGLGFLLFSFITNGSTWASSRLNTHVFTNRQLAAAGAVLDRNGNVLVETKDGARVWTSDSTLRKASLHLVGDAEGYIATGVQTLYRSSLIGYNFVNGLYRAGKDGGNDVRLTIDSEAQKAAYNALGGGKGTICAYNYKTGEVLCMVSAPTYDPMYKPASMNTSTGGAYDGVYMNRFLNGVFTPGSTFKVVTAICALDNLPNVRKRSFTCTGSYKIGDSAVKCNGVHGKITFERALNVSCNSVFAELAKELGNDALTATVRQLGFGKNVKVSGALTTKSTFGLRGAAGGHRPVYDAGQPLPDAHARRRNRQRRHGNRSLCGGKLVEAARCEGTGQQEHSAQRNGREDHAQAPALQCGELLRRQPLSEFAVLRQDRLGRGHRRQKPRVVFRLFAAQRFSRCHRGVSGKRRHWAE